MEGGGGGRRGGSVAEYLHGAPGMLPLQAINALFEIFGCLQHVHPLLPLCSYFLIQTLHIHTSVQC